MRTFIITLAALAVTASPATAWAQAGNTVGMVNLPGVAAKETSPLRRLPRTARAWVAAEKARLAANPRPLEAIAFDIQYELEKDILKVAERERLDTHDLIMVMLFDLTRGAADLLTGELKAMRAAGASESDLDAVFSRKAQIDAMVAEVVRNQSVLARQLSGNL